MEKAAFRCVVLMWGVAVLAIFLAGYASYRAAEYEKVVIGAAADTVVCEHKGEDCAPANLALILTKYDREGINYQAQMLWMLVLFLLTVPPAAFYLLRWVMVGRWTPWWPI